MRAFCRLQTSNARQLNAFEKLQRCAATGGNVRERVLIFLALFDGSTRIPATDDGFDTLTRQLDQLSNQVERSFLEALGLKAPSGPFQRMVLQLASSLSMSSIVFGPTSRPI